MDHQQNLSKILSEWVEKILQEPYSPFTKRQEKQISKKQNNFSFTGFSRNPLTLGDQPTIIATSSADISERTIMKGTGEIVSHIREWTTNRIDEMDCVEQIYDKLALIDEFNEWINIDNQENIEIISLDEISDDEYNDFVEQVKKN